MGRTRGAATPTTQELCITGVQAPIEVRRHPKARRMTLRVSRTRRAVIVTLPPQCDIAQAGTFLNSNIEWVQKHLGTLPQPVAFRGGAVIPLKGEPHVIVLAAKKERGTGIVTIEQVPGEISRLIVAGDQETGPRRLHRWLVDQARTALDERTIWHARRLGLHPRRITVRDQSTRWGSCSSTGALSFSWRLILAPSFVLDYVAAHEVAHLQQMNHGPRFWALVRKAIPDYRDAKQWLDVYGMDLHRYGP